MVAYRKITDTAMAYLLMPLYLDIWESKEHICYRVCSMLTSSNEDILFFVEVEDDNVNGILIAHVEDQDLIVWQSNGVDAKSIEPLVVLWGKQMKCNKMIIYTHRSPKAWARKYKLRLDNTERVNGMMRYEMSRAI